MKTYHAASALRLIRNRPSGDGRIIPFTSRCRFASSSASSSDNVSTNASVNEVNKFSSFASHWWDSRSNPLVGMNPIRVKFIRDVVYEFQGKPDPTNLQLPLHDKQILDIGCGGGLLTESLSRLGSSLAVGVDASPQVVDVAKVHSFQSNRMVSINNKNENNGGIQQKGLTNIKYVGGVTVEEFANTWLSQQNNEPPNELFDIITALEIVEHVPNPSSLLKAAASLLKPNGILFVSTINRTIKSYGMAIVAAEYITGIVPVGTHNWEQFFSPDEIKSLVCRDGSSMKQVALSGMVLRPPFLNMQWSLNPTDTDINWIGAYQKQF
jgi:ubiquinone biosynthesis O-methyltransferase